MVAQWLADYMFAGDRRRKHKGKTIAEHFNDATQHKSHGRRIDREEARRVGVTGIEDLEDDQALQEAVLTLYHLTTIGFEHSAVTKMLWSHTGRTWLKQWLPPQMPFPFVPPS